MSATAEPRALAGPSSPLAGPRPSGRPGHATGGRRRCRCGHPRLRPVLLALALAVAALAAGGRASGQAAAPPRPDGNGVTRDGPAEGRFDPEVARRYRVILEGNPEAGSSYRKLIELYGKGPGIAALLSEYEKLARDKPEGYAYRMILGHLQRTLGQDEQAMASYLEAARLKPGASLPYMSAASLAEVSQDLPRARELYEETLKRLGSTEQKEEILERLAEMALRNRDLAEAKRRLDALQRLDPADAHAASEVARIYERNGYLEEALEQWQAIAARESGNTPELVRVLKEMSVLQVKLGQDREAEQSLRRALGLVRPGNWNLPEIRNGLVEIYRRRDELRALIAEFEQSWTTKGYPELMLLAALHDEVGQEAEAQASYRKAVQRRPREAEPRLKLIAIHERKGELDEAIAEYKGLIAAQPGEFRHALALADVHQRRGETGLALKLLDALGRQGDRDAALLAALAERYQRYGMRDKALEVYRRLVALEPENENHLVDLGEQLYQMGKVDKALETWHRILEVVPDLARAWSIYGETLAGHDQLDEAIAALNQSVELAPDRLRFRKTLAGILRRAEKTAQAREVWRDILSRAGTDKLRAEAREQVVALGQELNELDADMESWRAAFAATPPDREAGHLLGLALARLKRFAEAESVWLRLLEQVPGDVDALIGLEICYGKQYRPDEAIRVLEKLAPLVPSRARELYQRAAAHAVQLHRDEDAVRWASRAVAMNPDDAAAHGRLAEILYRKQDLQGAVAAYQRALLLDPRDFKSYFQLAEIQLELGRTAEADRLYRQVLQRASDDAVLRKAARLAIQLDTTLGTLDALERDLIPLLFRVPSNPVFVRTLVELYGVMVKPLQQALRFGQPAEAAAARKGLEALSQRAGKALLEALASQEEGLVAQATDLLALLGTTEAAVPLGHFLDDKEMPTRVRAAVALGHIGDPRSVPSLVRALEDGEREVREAAAWSLGRIGTAEAAQALAELLRRKEPRSGVRAMALLGLGRCRSPAVSRPWIVRGLGDAREIARAAAAWAAGSLPRDPELTRALTVALERDSRLVRQAAAWSLGRWSGSEVQAALLGGLWGDEPALRLTVSRVLAGAHGSGPEVLEASLGFVDLELGNVRTQELVESLVRSSPGLQAAEPQRARPAAVPAREALVAALSSALGAPGPRRLACLEDLDPPGPALGLGPLTPLLADAKGQQGLKAALATQVRTLRELAGSGSPPLRAHALALLGKLDDPGSTELVRRALGDGEPLVREAAARTAGLLRAAALAEALGGLLDEDPSWSVRAAAARSLGQLGLRKATSVAALVRAAADAHALVREASASALGTLAEADAALPPLLRLLEDPLPSVRVAAAEALGRLGAKQAAASLRALDADAHPPVRQAARAALARIGG